MFLKSLTIKGFKSFADSTTLLMEPGVTVVVGPNGSGKSNVVDAIGWVLGAQAPSAVRSQKMDDVIFAGAAKRPALGRAEVSLTIDNSSGMLPIEFNEVTITRILFRNGDSEYSINGVPCRLLDIQELLSDSGVGRQQHVIISQGQIDAVLNARPEDRRLIIEEAAGVLKFRRRKEKAERRLAATEGNLTRLQDLLREVRRQLRPLEKQADAARRHGDVVAELTALRIHLAGQDLLRLRGRLERGEVTRRSLADDERGLRTRLRGLDADVLATEAKLTAMGGDDLGDALVRYEALRERGRGLAAVLAERRRGLERDRDVSVDEGVVANLDAESARLANDLAGVEAELVALRPEADEVSAAESDLAVARQDFQAEWADGVAAASGGAAEVRGELAAVRQSVERNTTEVDRGTRRVADLDARVARLTADAERFAVELAEVRAAEVPQRERVAVAVAAREAGEVALEEAEEARRRAEADQHTWSARAEALALALDQARAAAGAERLGAVAGVLGTLLDLVEVDDGWSSAFEAAAGEAIAAVVVDSVDAARRALAELQSGDVGGAVLALDGGRVPSVGGGDRSVRAHVRGIRPGVDELLDVLVGDVVVADGWADAVDTVVASPGSVVVTRDGDRFGPTGWRIGAAGAGATGAALEGARAAAVAATGAAAAASEAATARRAELSSARTAEVEATKEFDRTVSRIASLTDAEPRARRAVDEAEQEGEAIRAGLVEITERARRDDQRRAELEARLPALEDEEAAVAERGRAMAEARARLEDRGRSVAQARKDHDVRLAGLEERRSSLTRRIAEIEERLSRHGEERRQAEARRVELERRLLATNALADHVASHLTVVDDEVGVLRERRRVRSEATREVTAHLDATRKERTDAERNLTEVRERVQRAELEDAEVRVRLEGAVEALRRDLDTEPEAAMAAPAPELPEQVTGPARVRELERELRIMGPINPLALEEFVALQERHEFLQEQLEDVKSSRRDLSKVIKAIDAEIVSVFATAYAEVAENYAQLFETLFPGGRGRLKLTDPDDLLSTGIEVEARPSGKNVRKLSLLSGGERSLTALAYLFAVFRARPSPFYVMDEVEAALDDVNLSRFLGLVQEFRDDAQLIIVSHQKRTMEAADCLYGVTMAPGGSSKVVSENVR
ncbi:MAG: chromosome segregation protein SMC [Actinobacteria bacterium]|nr:chromosome segregation protein SMC [Actinomycetota bacterium]